MNSENFENVKVEQLIEIENIVKAPKSLKEYQAFLH